METEYVHFAFRWIHIVAALIWMGMLYFFNWVNGPYVAGLDAEKKKTHIGQLMPRALWWFRWAAAWTWVSGLIVLGLVFYHSKHTLLDANADNLVRWSPLAGVIVILTFVSQHIYDVVCKKVFTNLRIAFAVGWLLASVFYLVAREVGGFTFRGALIHLGAMLGTLMAFNVWFRIWPAQKRIIAAVRAGEAPPADAAALAGQRSRHNVYMSIPLVLAMMNQHAVIFDGKDLYAVPLLILVGFCAAHLLFLKSAKLKFAA